MQGIASQIEVVILILLIGDLTDSLSLVEEYRTLCVSIGVSRDKYAGVRTKDVFGRHVDLIKVELENN